MHIYDPPEIGKTLKEHAMFDQARFNDLVEEMELRGYRVNQFDARVSYGSSGFISFPKITFELVQVPLVEGVHRERPSADQPAQT